MTNDVKVQEPVMAKDLPRKKKRGKAASLDKRKARSGWLFVLPFIIGFVFIYFPMVFDSLKLTFMQDGGSFGFKNYSDALFSVKVGNATFLQTLVEGLGQMIFDIPAIIIFSLFMAVLLNQKMAGRALFRAIFFVPVILSTGIMEDVFGAVEDKSGGIDSGAEEENAGQQLISALDISALLGNMAVGGGLVNFVVEWINNIVSIVNRSGVQMLIFLAGLQSISPAIYESCQIDGASAWETFWKITFPMISPMILVNAIYTVIDSFTSGSNLIMDFINNTGSAANDGIRSAMYWMYFLVIILIVLVVAAICSAFVFYQRRND